MIESKIVYWLVCDDCGFVYEECESPEEAFEIARDYDLPDKRLCEMDGRQVCYDCTPQGQADRREWWVKMSQRSWGYWGVDPYTTARAVEEILDRGEHPPIDPPFEVLVSGSVDGDA